MKMKSLIATIVLAGIGALSFAQNEPAPAAPVKVEKAAKKNAKKHAHKVSVKKHKAAKHKKQAAM